jgi:hypothetical protein
MITFARDIGIGSYSKDSVLKAIEEVSFENLRRIDLPDFEKAFNLLIDFLEEEDRVKRMGRLQPS